MRGRKGGGREGLRKTSYSGGEGGLESVRARKKLGPKKTGSCIESSRTAEWG